MTQQILWQRKWKATNLKERSAAQEHFIDLCRLLGEQTPAEADPDGAWYCFERGASKLTGSDGWADVWKRGSFSWEYKGKHKDLKAAYVQLQRYSVALENPPLLVVCDLERQFPAIGPECVKGLEINPYAAELARVTVWIGEIQWMRRNGFELERQPILRPLDTIECRDAVMNPDSTEPEWPEAEFIVGIPPFLGGKLMRSGLGDHDVETLFALYRRRVPPEADLVTYWFEKARAQVESGQTKRVGLVATNSIRGGANRRVLDRIVSESGIFEAWSDEPRVIDGASVRVSLICFGATDDAPRLDGRPASRINADLTAGAVDLTTAKGLDENRGVSFMGDTKGGAFDVPGELARAWLQLPTNPNGRINAEVLRPWQNGQDITRRSADKWVIDFGWEMSEQEASLFEAPFEHVKARVFPERSENRRESYRMRWWRHVEPRPALMGKLAQLARYIVTPRVAKHRLFVWLDRVVLPDCQLIAIRKDDDATFGILHSRFHELWALRLGTSLEDRPRYTPSTTFETFPFSKGLTPDIPAAAYADDPRAQKIAAAAKQLDELRNNWLNPPDLVARVPEVVEGYPDRILVRAIYAIIVLFIVIVLQALGLLGAVPAMRITR